MADLQNPLNAHLFLLIQNSNIYGAFRTYNTISTPPLNFTCQATCQFKNTEKLSLISLLPLSGQSYWKRKYNDCQKI